MWVLRVGGWEGGGGVQEYKGEMEELGPAEQVGGRGGEGRGGGRMK